MATMPYNTRRKSLSLPSLGIQLPSHSRAHRSNSKTSSPDLPPPAKRLKRSHDDTPLSPSASPKQSPQRRVTEHTPPPSPTDNVRKIDTDGINDDIVVAVIEQLEKTGNRPHLIKELSTVLASTNENIAHSANAAALLSSRLSSYLKRPWTALSPCPVAKELIPVHPRKVFFFLTTQARMPLPENSDDIITPEIKRLTPSISDSSMDDVEHDRSRMSPSPEIELYSPELDHGSPIPSTPGEGFSAREGPQEVRIRPTRAPSPPLEADEKGFTETATAVRARGMSLKAPAQAPVQISIEERREDESPEMRQRKDQELLFGHLQVNDPNRMFGGSSPLIKGHSKELSQLDTMQIDDVDVDVDVDVDIDIDIETASWNLLSPENIDMEDLDGMLEGY